MSLRTAGIYNLTRTTRNILKRYRKEAPSLTMHLHSTGFRFGQTDSPVHAYDGELKHWIECIRQQKMPNDLLDVLDDSDIRFFDGCLIVEVHDHRSIDRPDHQPITEEATAAQNSPHPNAAASAPTNRIKAEASTQEVSQDLPNDQVTLHRLVLSPTCDTLWKDIQFMNEAKIAQMRGIAKDIKGKEFLWDPLTEDEAVALESAILERTTPALCLSPSIVTTRIANQMLGDTTLQPSTDQQKQRKRPLNSGEEEAMRRKRDRQERYMHIADESYGQPFAPTFSRVDLIKRLRSAPMNHLAGTLPPSQQVGQSQSPASTTQPNNASQNQRTASITIDPRHIHATASQPGSQPSAPSQPSNAHSHPQPAPDVVISPPHVPVPPPPAPAPVKKPGGKKKAPAISNVTEDPSESGSPAPPAPPAKKLSKKAQAKLDMTPAELALAEEKRKKKAEQRRLQKERKLAAAAAAQNVNQIPPLPSSQPPYATNPAPGNSHSQTINVFSGRTDGNIAVPGNNSIAVPNNGIGLSQANENGIPVFGNMSTHSNNTSSAALSNHGQNPGGPAMMQNNTVSLPTHSHSIPVPSLNPNSIPVPKLDSNSIPVQPTNTSHSILVPTKEMTVGPHNTGNMRMDLAHNIPVQPSLSRDIAVGNLMNQTHQAHSNGIPVPQSHDNTGIPVPQTSNRWPMGIGPNVHEGQGGFQASYPHGAQVPNPAHDPQANVGRSNEMDIRVHQHPPGSAHYPNPSNYNPSNVG